MGDRRHAARGSARASPTPSAASSRSAPRHADQASCSLTPDTAPPSSTPPPRPDVLSTLVAGGVQPGGGAERPPRHQLDGATTTRPAHPDVRPDVGQRRPHPLGGGRRRPVHPAGHRRRPGAGRPRGRRVAQPARALDRRAAPASSRPTPTSAAGASPCSCRPRPPRRRSRCRCCSTRSPTAPAPAWRGHRRRPGHRQPDDRRQPDQGGRPRVGERPDPHRRPACSGGTSPRSTPRRSAATRRTCAHARPGSTASARWSPRRPARAAPGHDAAPATGGLDLAASLDQVTLSSGSITFDEQTRQDYLDGADARIDDQLAPDHHRERRRSSP